MPFVPTDIAMPAAWYDASDTATITDAGGGAVSQWNDKSTNVRHLTQATAGSRPTTGTITLNSLNGIDFDGTADHLFRTTAFLTALATGFTAFAVTRADTTGIRAIFGESSSSDNDPGLRHLITAADLAQVSCQDNVNASRYSVDSTDIVDGAAHLTRWSDSLTLATLSVDGATAASSGVYTRGTVTNNRFAVGATVRAATTLFFDGGIFEIIIYAGVLTAGQISSVQQYLDDKWALTITGDMTIGPTVVTGTSSVGVSGISSGASPAVVTATAVFPALTADALVIARPSTVTVNGLVNLPADLLQDKIIFPETVDGA